MRIENTEFIEAATDDEALEALASKLRATYDFLKGPFGPKVPSEQIPDALNTLQSKVSVSLIRLARLFQYFVLLRADGTMPSLGDPVEELADGRRRFSKIHDFANSILHEGLEVNQIEDRYRSELQPDFPNLSLVKLAFLCRWAFKYHMSVVVESGLSESSEDVPVARVANALVARHGRGYSTYESGSLERLRRFCSDADSLRTESMHEKILRDLEASVSRLSQARMMHPMAFLTELSALNRYASDAIATEVANSKEFWQVSTGPDRVPLTGRIDAMLHIFCLRTVWPKGSGKTLYDIAEAAQWDRYSDTPEKSASDVISRDMPKEPWWDAFDRLQVGEHIAYWLREFSQLGFEEYMTTALQIEKGRVEINR